MNSATWIDAASVNCLQLLCIKVVKTGRVPQHIAFIMDGNRRFAKGRGQHLKEGHEAGFSKLAATLKWCLDLGIPEVTVYAFSIENLKRSPDEVNALMDIARDKFRKFLNEIDLMNEWGVRVVLAGRLSLLPADVRALGARVMLRTRTNTNLRLNIAYAYTGRDELATALSELALYAEPEAAPPIDAALISEVLPLSAPDMVVRTSGELRLSDFMIWQVSDAVLYFTPTLWPNFSIWEMLKAVLHYQRHAPPPPPPPPHSRTRNDDFLETIRANRWRRLEEYASVPCE